jgi:hypothetical protein
LDRSQGCRSRSADNLGHLEAAQTCQIKLDTRQPTTEAPSRASARRGRRATLKYLVNDLVPNGGTATVIVKVKNRAGKVKKTLPLGAKTVNTTLSATFRVPRTWKIGTYRFFVYATDTAGNGQSTVGSNKLIVK